MDMVIHLWMVSMVVAAIGIYTGVRAKAHRGSLKSTLLYPTWYREFTFHTYKFLVISTWVLCISNITLFFRAKRSVTGYPALIQRLFSTTLPWVMCVGVYHMGQSQLVYHEFTLPSCEFMVYEQQKRYFTLNPEYKGTVCY